MPLITEIAVPLLAVNDTTLTVTELSFSTGDKVNKGDIVMVFETSKTTYDVETAADGFIQYCCEPGRDYEVNEVVARIFSTTGETLADHPGTVPIPALVGATVPKADWEGETVFSNEAIRLLESSGLDRSLFQGSDFVSAADVLRLSPPGALSTEKPSRTTSPPPITLQSNASAAQSYASATQSHASAPFDPAKAIIAKLSSAKKREIEYLADIQSTGLTSTIHSYVDTEGIFVHLNHALKYLRDSLLPVIVYEVSRLLKSYPQLNAYFTRDGVAMYREVNPGFAIDIDKGLKVLKIAAAGEKSLQEIEAAILTLSGNYLDESIQLEDLTDITFTITDLSSESVAFFKPLINKMNSAILGVSAIDEKLQRCTLSLTFDHRVTEGKLAARFLGELKQRLESYCAEEGKTRQNIACFKCRKTLAEDIGDSGFVRCVTPTGKDGYICQSCLKGF